MELRKLVVALAALSFAGAAAAAGNTTGSSANNSSHDQMTTRQTSPQSTQNENGTSSTNAMGSSHGSASQAGSSSQGASSSQGGNSKSAASGEENNSTVREAQQALKDQGFNVGSIDGQMGPNTESALRNFQQSKNLPQTGNLDQQTLSALGVNENGASSQGSRSSQGSSPSSSMSSDHGKTPSQGTSTQNSAYK